jgi:hypothetical protein
MYTGTFGRDQPSLATTPPVHLFVVTIADDTFTHLEIVVTREGGRIVPPQRLLHCWKMSSSSPGAKGSLAGRARVCGREAKIVGRFGTFDNRSPQFKTMWSAIARVVHNNFAFNRCICFYKLQLCVRFEENIPIPCERSGNA